MAAPLAGGVFLLLGAIAWIGAALLMHHSTDFVLVTPPALLLIAAALAFVAYFRRPQEAEEEAEPEVEIVAPTRAERFHPDADEVVEPEEPPEMTIPAFAEPQPPPRPAPLRTAEAVERVQPSLGDDWDPRRRRPTPPRAKPAFRPVEEEDEEEYDEPSGFSRFALGFSSVLSFGLYAALAAGAVLIFWSIRNADPADPALAATETPAISSSAAPVSIAAAPSSEPVLTPVLPSSVEPAPSEQTTIAQLPPIQVDTPAPSSEESFGEILTPDDPFVAPRLVQDAPVAEAPIPTADPPQLPAEEFPSEPSAEPEIPAQPASVPTTGGLMPFTMPAQMAALRAAPATGPSTAASPPADTTGL